MFEWAEAKRLANLRKLGVDFADADEFDWDHAVIKIDDSENFGEERWKAVAYFRGHIHVIIYTSRRGRTRIISFRKAEKREIRRYEEEAD